MKRLLFRILLLPVFLTAFAAGAQTDVALSQFYEVPSFYNPSAVGNTDFLRIRGGAHSEKSREGKTCQRN